MDWDAINAVSLERSREGYILAEESLASSLYNQTSLVVLNTVFHHQYKGIF